MLEPPGLCDIIASEEGFMPGSHSFVLGMESFFCATDNVSLWRYEPAGAATCSPGLNSVGIVGG